jgi:hypothetical protein
VSERDNLPRWDGRRGRYEVWFLTLSQADAGYWIRYTVRAPIVGPPEPRLWFARFDRAGPESTFGVNASAPGIRLGREGFEVAMDRAVLRPGVASGSVEGGGHSAGWDLTFETGGPTYRLMPDALYRGGLTPTMPWSPNPSTRFRGVIEWDGRVVELDGIRGQQGHVFGSRHGERWAWASAVGEDGAAFQALSAQGRRGPFLTPFLTAAGVLVGGEWVRLHAISRRRSWGLGWWRIALRSRRYRLEASVRADPETMLRARYEDPDDTPRWCHHTELASARVVLWERRAGGWAEVTELEADGTAHAEWAGRTPAGAVPGEVEVA